MTNPFFKLTIHKYILTGFFTVVVDYAGIFLFYNMLHTNYILAIMVGFFFSNVFQFYTNFYYTFNLEKDKHFKKRIAKYVVSALIGMGIGVGTIILIKEFIVSIYLAKTISLVISFIYGYTASKYFVFKK